ncbi:MAG: hypothetical protein U0547_15185 [Dehalococcoidia bacterium]
MAVDGTYNITMTSPMGDRPATVTLAADGGALSGTFGGGAGTVNITDTSLNGNDVAWTATINGPMGEMKLAFKGAVDGDAIAGTVAFGAFGTGPFKGTRA